MGTRTVTGLVVVGCGLLVACGGVDSTDLGTGAMTATIVVVAGPADSQVTAVLSTDDVTSVGLSGDDELVAAAGPVSAVLERSSLLGSDSWSGGLDAVTEPGTEVTVTLRRADDDDPTSTVALPEQLFVVQPSAGEAVSRAADLVIGTNTGTGSNRVEWSGDCVADGSLDLAEGVPVVVPAGAVRASAGDEAQECALTYTLSRVVTGDLDPAFGGGSITAQRSVSVAVRSTP